MGREVVVAMTNRVPRRFRWIPVCAGACTQDRNAQLQTTSHKRPDSFFDTGRRTAPERSGALSDGAVNGLSALEVALTPPVGRRDQRPARDTRHPNIVARLPDER